jgi:chemotaxis protein methyltransferase CheR
MSLFSFLSHSKDQTEDNSETADQPIESCTLLLSDELFTRLRDFIYKNCGIYYKDNKRSLLENRISGRLKFHKLGSFASYLDMLNQPGGRDELNMLIEAITINETYFFRDLPQFDILEKYVIREIISERKTCCSRSLKNTGSQLLQR